MIKTLTASLTKRKLAFGLLISSLLFLVLIVPSVASADGFLEGTLWTLVNGVFGYMVWVGGNLLNYSITEFVIGFGAMYQSQGMGVAVNELWGLIRDIFNLLFIFGLVYIGLRLILDSENSSARRMLVNIILAALLINFSMFFSKAIIDFTNIAAAQITNAFPPSSSKVLGIGGQPLYGISDQFMKTLGLTSIWGSEGSLFNVNNGTGGDITYIFSTMIIFIIAAFVFMAGALLLAIRFAALNLFIILSPVMFLGWIFPNLSSFTTRYWHNFLGRAFFAPAYLLMLYISWRVLVSFRDLAGGGEMSKAMNGDPLQSAAQLGPSIAFFIVVCVFLIASIVIAQRMSVDGASFAINTMGGYYKKGLRKMAGFAGTTIKIASAPVRDVTRTASNYTGQKVEKFVRNQQKKGGVTGWMARSQAGDSLGMGVATGLKNSKVGFGLTHTQEQQRQRDVRAAVNKSIGEEEKDKTYTDAAKVIETGTGDLSKALQDLGKIIKGLSAEDAAAMGIKNLSKPSTAANISDTQLKEWKDKGVFTTTEIDGLRTSRDTALNRIARYGNAETIHPTEFDDRGLLESEANLKKGFTNNEIARFVTDDDIDNIISKRGYTGQEATDFKDRVIATRTASVNRFGAPKDREGYTRSKDPKNLRTADQRETLLRNRRSSDYANMPASIFTQADTYKYVTPSALGSRLDNDDNPPKPEELGNIKKALAIHLGLQTGETPNKVVEKYNKDNKEYDAKLKSLQDDLRTAENEIRRVPNGTPVPAGLIGARDTARMAINGLVKPTEPTDEVKRWAKFERDSVNNGNRAHLFMETK